MHENSFASTVTLRKKSCFLLEPVTFHCSEWKYVQVRRKEREGNITIAFQRANTFSMCAGDFLQTTNGDDECWSVVVTVFFIDTATNLMNYIDTIHRSVEFLYYR